MRHALGSFILVISISAVFAEDAIVARLIPRPRQIERVQGEYTIQPAALRYHISAESVEAAGRLADRWHEILVRLEYPISPDAVSIAGKGNAYSLTVCTSFPTAPLETIQFPDAAREQGYELIVGHNAITIRATSEVGLFYGFTTLDQLLQYAAVTHCPSLPRMRIVDWPALPMRGFSEDYGRNQLPTLEDHQRSIRNLARFKMNTYLFFIESDHFQYSFDPDLGKEFDRFSFDELRAIDAYAKQYYIEVIPTVELLGHMEMTLSDPKYKSLAEVEGGGDLCATCDDSFDLVRKMVNDIAPAFSSHYFHAGLDESFQVGKGRSKAEAERLGVGRIHANYYNKMHDLLASHGKTMMMYADIALHYPDTWNQLPKDILMMFWDYTPRDRYDGLTQLKDAGFPIVSLSGLWDWYNLYPIYTTAFPNIETLAAQTVQDQGVGHFVSSWGDGQVGEAGTNLSEWTNYGVAYCCSQAWNPLPSSIPDHSQAFALQFFGTQSEDISQALTLLAGCQGNRSHHARRCFQKNPAALIAQMKTADAEEMNYWRTLQRDSEQAHLLLSRTRVPQNEIAYQAIDLAAQMLNFTADMTLLCRSVADSFGTASFNSHHYALEFDRLAERQQTLWKRFQKAYSSSNRPINLKHIESWWKHMHHELTEQASQIRSGEWVIPGQP